MDYLVDPWRTLQSSRVRFFLAMLLSVPACISQVSENAIPDPAAVKELRPFPEGSQQYDRPRRDFVKRLEIESFGLTDGLQIPGYELSTAYMVGFYNWHGLECPGCMMGLPNRTRFTLPAFGSRATYRLWNGRFEVFGAVGGIQAWRPGMSTSATYGDSWLVQAGVGARVAIDRQRRFWLGGSVKHSYSPRSVLEKQWNSFSGSASYTFGK